jgi:hypothetical protein
LEEKINYATVESTLRLVMKLEIEIKKRLIGIEERLKRLENKK